jgi:Cu/Ag efflux protein CusF
MLRRSVLALILVSLAGAAHAQPGRGGPGGGGGRGGRGGGDGPPTGTGGPPKKARPPANPYTYTGVVKAIDTATGRITIAYEAVEDINWPAGSQPFPVAKTAMLSVATVGQKVRFNLESGQISALVLDTPPAAAPQ